jgi:ABC-2 type transport system permease protein
MISRILSLIHARNLEFFRDRASLSWNLLFPLIVILGFGFGFSGNSQKIFKVSVFKDNPTHSIPFLETKYVNFVTTTELLDAQKKLSRHQYDMLVEIKGDQVSYWINESNPKGYLLEKILFSNASSDLKTKYLRQTIEGLQIRYVDWLIAGMLGMNMMFSALFGVGYSIVRYRKNGVLKRLKATPITSFEFLSSQILSRVFVILTMSSVIFLGSKLLVNFVMLGSYWLLVFIFGLGALCLISMGLLIASFLKSEELAGGLLQIFSWPMMFLSGVWFSLEGFSPLVKKIAMFFPLTHVIEAARAVMTEGAVFSEISGHLLVLGILALVFTTLSSFIFKWE